MELNTHKMLMEIRELLKNYSILIYTGSPLDDIVLMELELEDLHESGQVETQDFLKMKMALRQAYREAGGE